MLETSDLILERLLQQYGKLVGRSLAINELRENITLSGGASFRLSTIKRLLRSFGIITVSYKIDFEDLSAVGLPAILSAKSSGGIVIVDKSPDGGYQIYTGLGSFSNVDLNELQADFTGLLIAFHSLDGSVQDASFRLADLISGVKDRYFMCAALFFPILFMLINAGATTTMTFLFCLLTVKLVGLFITTLFQTDRNVSARINKWCIINNQDNCSAVLNSSASRFLSIKLTTWGLGYYAVTIALTLFSIHYPEIWNLIRILNILTLPVSLYLIIYQFFIINKVCILCISIQLLLWAEFFIELCYGHYSLRMQIMDIFPLFFFVIMFIILFELLERKKKNDNKLSSTIAELSKLKYRHDVFGFLMASQPLVNTPDVTQCINWGNGQSKNHLLIVTNLYCEPCKKSYLQLKQWLLLNPDTTVSLIFSGDLKDPVVKYFMAIWRNLAVDVFLETLLAWFKSGEIKDFRLADSISPSQLDGINELLKYQQQWIKEAGIERTPAIFLNGRKLPDEYSLEDTKYLI
ncbi:Peptidase C39 family protein [Mucilaginibacter sp. OK268]|uniref:vitamin K epoxide reductase family protein n=1 Tax=Mucilaginibacter sp. OK268 TaxID=1881048 RepID=UPI00088EA48E|nr:vitamin K epoxide reductase family protein [Mucilaginibacter sp. OK268]SDP99144.1 Peptidase C39 family protein [Mucilaginibacter sp. OK268]